jgi:transposase
MPKGVPNKRYTPEFKRMVVETMKKEHLSIYTAMQEFGINDHKIIERWERIYLEEGPEGLAIERRGRSSKGRPPKQLPKQVEENLLAEVQRLRAENDYKVNLKTEIMIEDLYDKVNAILARQTALEKQLTEKGESAWQK